MHQGCDFTGKLSDGHSDIDRLSECSLPICRAGQAVMQISVLVEAFQMLDALMGYRAMQAVDCAVGMTVYLSSMSGVA